MIQLIEYQLRSRIPFQFKDNPHTVPVGFIPDIGNPVNPFVFDQVGNSLNNTGFVDHVGNFGDDNRLPSFCVFLNIRFCTQGQFAAASRICAADSASAHDNTAGREVRAFNIVHQLVQTDVRVVDNRVNCVTDLAQVMGRDIGRHTNCDTGRTVDQQVGIAGRQDLGFLAGIVKVGIKVDGILADIGDHILRHFAHPRFGITVSSRRVAVNRTKVSVAVYQLVAH